MRHGPKVWTEKVIAERIKAGAGQGQGENYQPWLTVHDLASRGRQTRTPMKRFKRTVHTHSYIERAFLLLAEFEQNFFGIHDQVPIPRDVTLGAARSLGIRHPTYPVSGIPVVMTFDFVLMTPDTDGVIEYEPWDCKREATLKNRRVLEKLSIHRAAAEHLGMKPARLFTELSVPKQVIRNIEWIRATLPLAGESTLIHKLFASEQAAMLADITQHRPCVPIWAYCSEYDHRRQFQHGMALRVLGWLLWEHQLSIDLSGPMVPQQMLPLPDQNINYGREAA